MANGIKIGNFDVSSFKVGSNDCTIYLGDTLLYPTTPVSYKLVAEYSDGTTYRVPCNGDSALTQAEVASHTSPISAMTSAVIGDDCVTSIGNNAFSACEGLTSVTIPSSVTSIGTYAFNSCTGLTSVNIPSGVTTIDNSAFNNCKSLTSVTMPDGATSIGSNAFSYCYSLTSMNIPSSVTSIGANAFSYCYSLTSVNIPSGVTSISNAVFQDCSGLTSVTIPNSVTSIGNGAFNNCKSLTSMNIPSSVTSIGANAFYVCSGLTSCTIGSGVTSIGGSAFMRCTSLTTIDIPSGVTTIGQGAFSNCSSLTSATFRRTTAPRIGSNAFVNCTSLNHIYIPTCNSADGYGAQVGLNGFTDRIYALDGTQCTVTPPYSAQSFTIVAKASGSFKFTKASSATFSYMRYSTNNGSSWLNYTSGNAISVAKNGTLQFLFNCTSATTVGIGTINGNSNYTVEGNARSLWGGTSFTGATTLGYNYQLYNLFSGQTKLQSAENLVLPSTTLKTGCYRGMFKGCTALTTAPELPAATLQSNCYREMYSGCTSLADIRCYATNISASNCTTNWAASVKATGTFTKKNTMSSWTSGANGIPSGWTVKNKT